MMQIVLIGIGAGAAAALLFASLASGSVFALVLFYLAPLPILIAGIGWNSVAGLIATFVAAACLALALDFNFGLTFLVGIGLPAWWLGYLALLARPADGAAREVLEWYPPGRILLWMAAAGAIATILVIPYFGTDGESVRAGLKAAIDAAFQGIDPERRPDSDTLAKMAPGMAAALATMVLLINTWLAARVVKLSGQLRRPWPDFSAVTLPKTAPAMLAAALAGMFLPGLLGIVFLAITGGLIIAFAALGFAVLHMVTRGVKGRQAVLAIAYTVVFIFGYPAIILALLGLADTAIDLRGRVARTRGPPTLH